MNKLHMSSHETEGLLITFCGLDGCGKTTMIQRLKQDFEREREVLLTKQPTEKVRKSTIFRTYMDSPDHSAFDYRSLALLAASDRLQHGHQIILPELERGNVVISDRYFYSCLANLRARGFQKDKWIYEIAKEIIKPDVAFFLDIPVEVAVSRVRTRIEEKNRYIDLDLQFRLRDEYLKICKENDGVLISTQEDESKCYEKIKNAIKRRTGYELL